MRLLTLMVWLPALLAAQDAREIVRRAIDAEWAGVEASRNYTYTEHQETREMDGSGKVKSREGRTWDVMMIEGSPYRRLVATNGKPLAPKEQKKEDEKLRLSREARARETEPQRQQRIADWHHKQEKQREPLREILDGFNFQLMPDENLNGRAAWVVEAMPRPGYKPKLKSAFFFPKVRMRFWIDRQDYRPLKAEMELLDTVSWGGILARLPKGDRLTYELTRVDDGVWVPKSIRVSGSARVLLVKGFRGELEIDYSDYRKSPAVSRVVTAGQ